MPMFRFAVVLLICSFTALADEQEGIKIHGLVLLPDGSPAKDVEVAMVTHKSSLMILKGRFLKPNGEDHYFTSTNEAGRFTFVPFDFEKENAQRFNMILQFASQIEIVDFILFFLHDAGFKRLTQQAWESLDENKTITLESWGRIEGNVRVGTQPGKDLFLSCNIQFNTESGKYEPHILISSNATADAEGKFSIDRLPAGSVRVSRQIFYNVIETSENDKITNKSHSIARSHASDTIDLQPGETAYVQIGGVGRPVIGKVVPSREFEKMPDLAFAHIECFQVPEKIGDSDPMVIQEKMIPKEIREAGIPLNQMEWINWLLSSEGKQYQADVETAVHEISVIQARNLEKYTKKRVCAVAKDGTFRLDDVPEGDWTLRIVLEDPVRKAGAPRLVIGLLEGHEFRIAAIPDGILDEPLDIGSLEIKPFNENEHPLIPAVLRR